MARRNPFDTAVEKGRQACRDGLSLDDNPYPDHRKAFGQLSWSRAWRNAWAHGWLEEEFNLPKQRENS